jgi:16S rRNA processing protein RimM
LDGITTRNQAEELVKSGVYIEDALLESEEEGKIFLKEILGFSVFNEKNERLGEIIGFGSNGAQDLLKVKLENGREASIPFVEPFIRNIDFDKRELAMELPEGLLDLED